MLRHLPYLLIVTACAAQSRCRVGVVFQLEDPTWGLAQDASAATRAPSTFLRKASEYCVLNVSKEFVAERMFCSRNSGLILYMKLALSPFVHGHAIFFES